MATYTVQPGDTLSEIAARHHTTTDILARLNDIANPDMIPIGLVLALPDGAGPGGAGPVPTSPVGASPYTVGSGILQAMAADQTTPATDEVYWHGIGPDVQWSEAIGRNGTVYRWVKATNKVHRFRSS